MLLETCLIMLVGIREMIKEKLSLFRTEMQKDLNDIKKQNGRNWKKAEVF